MRLQRCGAAHGGVAAVDRLRYGEFQAVAALFHRTALRDLHGFRSNARAQALEIDEIEARRLEQRTERAQHAPAGARIAAQFAGGLAALFAAFEVDQRRLDFRNRTDRQDHVGHASRGIAGVVAERDHARIAQGLQRGMLVGEIQARFQPVRDVGLARIAQHRLRIARGGQHARARESERVRALRDATDLRVLRGCESGDRPADRSRVRAVFGHAADDHRDVHGIAHVDLAQRVGELRRRHDLLGGDFEREIEIDRIDHVHLRAAHGRAADAVVQQRHFMAQVGTDDDDGLRLFEFGDRHGEGFGHGAVGQVELADAVVEVAAAERFGHAREQGALLVRGRRMHQHAEIVAAVVRRSALAQDLRRFRQRFVPRGFAEILAVADQGNRRAVLGVQALVRIAVAVREPALVHRLVVARHAAQDLAAAHVVEQVAAERVVPAQRFLRRQFPRPRLEAEHLVGQRADRADVDDVAGKLGRQRLAVVGADLQVLAALHAAEFVGAGDVRGEADAARALDAAGHVAGDQRAEILVGHDALALGEARHRTAVAEREVLQFAFAALVADRAIERMVDQQEFHHVALRLQGLVAAREHLHAVGDRGGAGRLRLGQRLAAHFRLDQAHAAVRRDRQLVVVAEARDRDAGLVRGLDDHRALGRGAFHAIDEDGDVVRRQVRVHRLRTHAATSTGFASVPARSSST